MRLCLYRSAHSMLWSCRGLVREGALHPGGKGRGEGREGGVVGRFCVRASDREAAWSR